MSEYRLETINDRECLVVSGVDMPMQSHVFAHINAFLIRNNLNFKDIQYNSKNKIMKVFIKNDKVLLVNN